MLASEHPCRVCLAEGARNIFSTSTINDETCTVASINHIRHKLQYVTQLQVNENDGLPFWICELCVVQLNIAYRFKLLAGESDRSLRQRLESREASTDIPNALTLNETVPSHDGKLPAVKQEPLNAARNTDLCESPLLVSGQSWNAANLTNSSASDTNHAPAMVCLQRDLINPAEDEAYLKEIVDMKVIAIPWEIICDSASNDRQPSTSSASNSPKQSVRQDTPADSPAPGSPKTQAKKRKRSGLDRRRSASSTKDRSKRRRETETTADAGDTMGTPKENLKPPSKAALRKRRLQKLVESLRIDMMDDKLMNRYKLTQDVPTASNPKVPMKRRNSICVSSFTEWF
uniref:ZAD domain-containing protein n=1 Tax=Anopheles epiroticus TaxID=199890 RepID=A0A182PF01_9DIPT